MISSRLTAFYKKAFPALWFGLQAVLLAAALTRGARGTMVVVPCLLIVFGLALMKGMFWDLVDEVYDCGDYLLIKNRGQEHRLALADIGNVSASRVLNPPRIKLKIAHAGGAGPLGTEVVFSPPNPFVLNPLAKNPIAEDLIARVDRARRRVT